ncbi:MAG: multicopper oxidase domain-containing protein [Natronomonas sp.]
MRRSKQSRRRFLTTAAAGSLAGLAGCVAGFMGEESSNVAQPDEEEHDAVPGHELTDHPWTAPPTVVELEDGDSSTIRSVPSRHAVLEAEASGGPITVPEVWAWQADDHDPSVPGPIYRVEEGASFEIELENTEDIRPHTFHLHALKKDWEEDGVPTTTGNQVDPNESFRYSFEANVPGTHVYHCHYQTQNHLDMGMYGIFRVDPVDYDPPDKEFFLTLGDWDMELSRQFAGAGEADYSHRERTPDVFTINGRSGPTTFHPEVGSPLIVEEGDTVRVHLSNNGYETHPIHVHNHRYEVVEKDGSEVPDAARFDEDVTPIAPAERKVIEFEADRQPGIYLMHCHKVHHVMNGDTYPGGMVTPIVYESAMDTPQFEQAMELAGFEG